jgi:hypothetical protein
MEYQATATTTTASLMSLGMLWMQGMRQCPR